MNGQFFPWIEAALLVTLAGAAWTRRQGEPQRIRRRALATSCAAFVLCLGAWFDLLAAGWPRGADEHFRWFADPWLSLDALSGPLLPLAALVYLLTVMATLGGKVERFSWTSVLVSESLLLATLAATRPWLIVALLAAGTLPPLVELALERRPWRVAALSMTLFVGLLVLGQALVDRGGPGEGVGAAGVALLTAAVVVRSGLVPFHFWMRELFERAAFGTALLFVAPMAGTYAAVRLVFPLASDGLLGLLAGLSLATALYGAGMALVQRECRRLFCYLFLSHSSLVLVGLEMATPVAVTAALCTWVSVTLAMAGFGLVLRAVEARVGRLSLDEFHGLFAQSPRLAALFLITGLASIGFPGTIGFVGTELLVDGVVHASPFTGAGIVVAAALNGLAVVNVYFRVFTGGVRASSINLRTRPAERVAVYVLTALILGGGLFPQPGIASRYEVAKALLEKRRQTLAAAPADSARGFAEEPAAAAAIQPPRSHARRSSLGDPSPDRSLRSPPDPAAGRSPDPAPGSPADSPADPQAPPGRVAAWLVKPPAK